MDEDKKYRKRECFGCKNFMSCAEDEFVGICMLDNELHSAFALCTVFQEKVEKDFEDKK